MLANLPPDTLPISEFAEKHGITYRSLRHYIENGVEGDHLEITAIPFEVKGRPNYKIKLLTPEQQDMAIEFFKRHRTKYGLTNTSAPRAKPTSINSPYAGGRDRELPPGCILYTDFAEKIGIPISTLRDYITKGIPRSGGIKIEAETRPKPSKPSDTQRYLTARQQLTAIELLDRYRKLSMSPSEVSRLREVLQARANSSVEALP
jgi:DNA-binding transcriptional MerR regulator